MTGTVDPQAFSYLTLRQVGAAASTTTRRSAPAEIRLGWVGWLRGQEWRRFLGIRYVEVGVEAGTLGCGCRGVASAVRPSSMTGGSTCASATSRQKSSCRPSSRRERWRWKGRRARETGRGSAGETETGLGQDIRRRWHAHSRHFGRQTAPNGSFRLVSGPRQNLYASSKSPTGLQ